MDGAALPVASVALSPPVLYCAAAIVAIARYVAGALRPRGHGWSIGRDVELELAAARDARDRARRRARSSAREAPWAGIGVDGVPRYNRGPSAPPRQSPPDPYDIANPSVARRTRNALLYGSRKLASYLAERKRIRAERIDRRSRFASEDAVLPADDVDDVPPQRRTQPTRTC